MCNASEVVYERGKMEQAKETTFTLADRGMAASDIAEILKISEEQV